MLLPEAYSKIFTHIVSLMVKNEIKKIREGEISIIIQPKKKGVKISKIKYFHNIKYNDEKTDENTHAYYRHAEGRRENILTAVLYEDDNHRLSKGSKERYSALWNILNLLGAHEYEGHGIYNYRDEDKTHNKAYKHQMHHSTWENTTHFYKEEIKRGYEQNKNN